MIVDSDLLPPSLPHRLVALLGRVVRAPFVLVIAILERVVAEILARLVALPVLLVTAVLGEIERARLRRDYRLEGARDALELRRRQTAVETPFRAILLAIERADRAHAQLDPHFEESLAAAQETFTQQLQALRALARELANQ